jgi:hypothetical protein
MATLLPSCGKTRAATANRDPEIVHGIGGKFMAGFVTLLQRALRPVGEPGFVVVCAKSRRHEIKSRLLLLYSDSA